MSDDQEPQDLLEASDAVKYLAERWGVESYSLGAFRAYRFRLGDRLGIKPVLASHSTTWWRKSDLDKIPRPDRTRPRGPRKKRTQRSEAGEEQDMSASTMILMKHGHMAGVLQQDARLLRVAVEADRIKQTLETCTTVLN